MDWTKIVTKTQPAQKRSSFILSTVSIIVILLFSSCAAIFISPLASIKGEEFGGGVEAGVGSIPLTKNLGLNGVAGYHYYDFENGHDNFMKVGAQIRSQNQSSALWYGGEFCVVRDVSVYKDSYWNENPSASGVSVGAIAGYRLSFEAFDMSIFSGLSLVNFGDFKADDIVVEPSHSPLQFRVGLEFDLPFSR